MIWNALDYTALVLPTGLFVDPVLDVKKPAHTFFNDLDKTNYDLCKKLHFSEIAWLTPFDLLCR